jgi:hypothetical protein
MERWEAHRDGRADWAGPMWTVLMFQAWMESMREARVTTAL